MSRRRFALTLTLLLAIALPLLTATVANAQARLASREAWTRRYFPSSEYAMFTSVVTGPGGVVYAMGFSFAGGGVPAVVLAKYDAAGHRRWLRTYDGVAHGGATFLGVGHLVAVDHAGNVVVACTAYLGGGTKNVVALKYTPGGKLMWVGRRHETGEPQDVSCLGLDAAGNVYVAGRTTRTSTGDDYIEVKFAAASGRADWAYRYAGPGGASHGVDLVQGIAVDHKGDSYMTGISDNGDGNSSIATVKLTPAGHKVWVRRLNRGVSSEGHDLALGKNGDLYLVGNTFSGGLSGTDTLLARYSPNGTLRWTRLLSIDQADDLQSMVIDNKGSVLALGVSSDGASQELVYKWSAAGDLKWVKTLPAAVVDPVVVEKAIAVDSQRTVYCGGYWVGGRRLTSAGFTVAAYSSTGHLKWSDTYAAAGDVTDYCLGLAANSDAVYGVGQANVGVNKYAGVLVKYHK